MNHRSLNSVLYTSLLLFSISISGAGSATTAGFGSRNYARNVRPRRRRFYPRKFCKPINQQPNTTVKRILSTDAGMDLNPPI